jgi:hypothetical protein
MSGQQELGTNGRAEDFYYRIFASLRIDRRYDGNLGLY